MWIESYGSGAVWVENDQGLYDVHADIDRFCWVLAIHDLTTLEWEETGDTFRSMEDGIAFVENTYLTVGRGLRDD